MKKIILLKGLPGCGKTTWARMIMKKHPGMYKRINKDDLRAMFDDGKWSRNNEKFILQARDMLAHIAINDNYSVIIDDTNLAPKHEINLKKIAVDHGVEFETKDFTDVPIETCVKQDLMRANSVGEAVIRKMYNQFLKPKPAIIEHDPSLPDAIVIDLDGTLSLFGDKNPYDRDFTKDDLNTPVAHIIMSYVTFRKTKIIFVSGRKDIYRDQTEEWLKDNGFLRHGELLYMRKTQPPGVQEPKDTIVKKEIYDKYIKNKYNVLLVFDDRPPVVKMWREEIGLFVLDCNQSGIDF